MADERAIPAPDAIYAWQVLDSADERWRTIAVHIGGNLMVLTSRDLAMAEYQRPYAEGHQMTTGLPVRLHRFEFDPSFDGEEVGRA